MRMLLPCLMAAGLAACTIVEAMPEAKKADPRWGELIVERSAGRVPRAAPLFIRFAKDVFPAGTQGRAVEGLLETVPPIRGAVIAAGPREALLVHGGLKPGARYLIRLKAAALAAAPAGAGDYEFVVSVLERDLSLSLEALAPDGVDGRTWALKGRVETADVEDDERVEKTVTAIVDGRAVELRWSHDRVAKSHAFTIAGIRRAAASRKIRLSLNGRPIGARRIESRLVEIPAESSFAVSQARAVSDREQYAAVHFSAALDPGQDLRGLVRLSSGGFTTRVEGNVLKLFPAQRVVGLFTVSVEPGLRAAGGQRLARRFESAVVFASEKPQVRFAGAGVILPDNDVLSIPFEALNARAVQVTAFRVYADDVGQFLQVNALPGDQELGRVGRFLWRKTLRLKARTPDQWQRYALDAGELLRGNRGGLIRLTLSLNRAGSDYACPEGAGAEPPAADKPLEDHEDLNSVQASGWDGVSEWYEPSDAKWTDRADPCKDAYYQLGSGTRDSRNFLASDLGLVAKRDARGALKVAAASLRTAKPLEGVEVTAHNFQGAALASGKTGADGLLRLAPKGKPFYLSAARGADRGYLKVSDGLALPMSHFDTGGQRVEEGLKGFLYGERGVWRPGDEVHLTLIVEDAEGRLPKGHPAVLRLHDPKGRLARTLTNARPVGGFYRFTFRTPEDAPTGLWTAKARVGGAEFAKDVRIEAVMPNRLRVELDFGRKSLRASAAGQQGSLFAQWLHGAKAGGLKADVAMRLSPEPTRFSRFSDHVFDDPASQLSSEPREAFSGTLDPEGRASFPLALPPELAAPGMLSAQFHLRVFEEGGAFSSMRQTLPLHAYDRYVGLKLPKGDQARDMLLTDTTQQVSIVSLDADGNPVSAPRVRMTLHKLGWKWWWDKSGESLAQYAAGSHADVVLQETASTTDGRGGWTFKILYPAWGRYLLRACDLDGGHCAGEIFYIDWPGWAGRAREQSGPGAHVVALEADRAEYQPGQTARVRLPAAAEGRALISVENGTRVLSQRWVSLSTEPTTVPVAISSAMSPNVYVTALVLQPHRDKKSDRPIRLYGVLPLSVKDPATELFPAIETAPEWRPESEARVSVSEGRGRAMTYTLAVVDEGLLGLTAFATPDARAHFYRKEALGIATWDVYDHVVGAYGGALERLLALGGSEALGELREKESTRRFPPVVRYLGPFRLKAGETRVHEVPLSAYVGAVRLMAVAGEGRAYGRAEKTVPVRQPLMLQPTLPRVAGPGEELTVPVSVFAMSDEVRQARVTLQADGPFSPAGPASADLRFDAPGEKMAFFTLRTSPKPGSGTIRLAAVSGRHRASAQVRLAVRAPNPPTTRQSGAWIEPGGSWSTARLVPHGLPGTQEVFVEASSLPPLNLERRLGELIRYPHGCLEQTTSTLFPQFFLGGLVRLSEAQKRDVEKNVRGGLERLRAFQAPSGGFLYWPGPGGGGPQSFATSYVGQFLLEAERRGYALPPDMRAQWERYQKERAAAWTPGGAESALEQAYRLYTLALAGKAELGAMNLLREEPALTGLARWMLASAYHVAGVRQAADVLAGSAGLDLGAAREPGPTFASPLRDKALVLQALTLRKDQARAKPLAEEVSASLASEQWHHTQALAQALMALARFYGEQEGERGFSYETSVGTGAPAAVSSAEPIHRRRLEAFPPGGAEVVVRNTSRRRLYAALITRGVPAAGDEKASAEGLSLSVEFLDAQGGALDPARLSQGAPVTAAVTVTNTTGRALENLALTFLAPAGWEIRDDRRDAAAAAAGGLDHQDVRDDRVLSYFGLKPGQALSVPLRFTAAYAGRYFMPAVVAESMYESAVRATTEGRWVSVERR